MVAFGDLRPMRGAVAVSVLPDAVETRLDVLRVEEDAGHAGCAALLPRPLQYLIEDQVAVVARVMRRIEIPAHPRGQIGGRGQGFHCNAAEAAEIPQGERLSSGFLPGFLREGGDQGALPRFEERPPADAPVQLEIARVHGRDEEAQVDVLLARV
jgi:hypothetical protein